MALDSLEEWLNQDGIYYSDSVPRFSRSKLYAILRDRSYIGEVKYQGQCHSGTQKRLVDRVTWDTVQVLLGEKVYRSHELTYAGGLIKCKHCSAIVTGESVVKKTTGKEYVSYHCSQYNAPGHPRVRLNEEKSDLQMLAIFDKMRIENDGVREWFAA